MSTIISAGTVPNWGLTSPQGFNSTELLVSSYSQTASAQKYDQTDGDGFNIGTIWYGPTLTATLDGAVARTTFDGLQSTAVSKLATELTLSDLNTELLSQFDWGTTFTAYVENVSDNRTAGGAMTRNYSASIYPY